jgi:hypothetical protein
MSTIVFTALIRERYGATPSATEVAVGGRDR